MNLSIQDNYEIMIIYINKWIECRVFSGVWQGEWKRWWCSIFIHEIKSKWFLTVCAAMAATMSLLSNDYSTTYCLEFYTFLHHVLESIGRILPAY